MKGKNATKHFNSFMHGDIPLFTFFPLIQLPKTKHDLIPPPLYFHNDSCKSTNVLKVHITDTCIHILYCARQKLDYRSWSVTKH